MKIIPNRLYLTIKPTISTPQLTSSPLSSRKLYFLLLLILTPLHIYSKTDSNEYLLEISGTVTWMSFLDGNWDEVAFQGQETEFLFRCNPTSNAYSIEIMIHRSTSTKYNLTYSDGTDVFVAEQVLPHTTDGESISWHPRPAFGYIYEGRFPSDFMGEPPLQALLIALHPDPFWLIEEYHTFPITSIRTGNRTYDFAQVSHELKLDSSGALEGIRFIAPQVQKSRAQPGETFTLPDGYSDGYHVAALEIQRARNGDVVEATYKRGLPKDISDPPSGPEDTFAGIQYRYKIDNVRSRSGDALQPSERLDRIHVHMNDERNLLPGRRGYALSSPTELPFRDTETLAALAAESVFSNKPRGIGFWFSISAFFTLAGGAAYAAIPASKNNMIP